MICQMRLATTTRPDVANAVGGVSSHDHDLRQTRLISLPFQQKQGPDLVAYADTDDAGEKHNQHSVSRLVLMCSGARLFAFLGHKYA